MGKARASLPIWPDFVFERLTKAEIEQLSRMYADFKAARQFPRSVKLSSTDFATVYVAIVEAQRRHGLGNLAA